MRKIISLLLVMLLCFAAVGCGGKTPPDPSGGDNGNNGNIVGPGDGDDNDGDDEGDTPMPEKIWNKEPVIKKTFYDDFKLGVRGEFWQGKNETWGANNHGTTPENVLYTTNRTKSAEFGAESGGVVAIRSTGDLYPDESKRRQGGCLITTGTYGPGLYEVRMKVVPRLGQCTAAWTYYNGGGTTKEDNIYSEIDIEMPMQGTYKKWAGTTYEYFVDWGILAERTTANVEDENGINDGKWHTYAFEWRTDEANGDKGVVWYQDGKKVAEARENVPKYKAAFNIGNWFPDDKSWVGVPDFEEAFMYVDWVKITEYEDPSENGGGAGGGGSAVNLGSKDIPMNDYVANGKFVSADGKTVYGWGQNDGGEFAINGDSVTLNAGKKVTQTISAQYKGYSFKLNADIAVAGSGKCKVYVDYMNGAVKMGGSQKLEISAGDGGVKTLEFTIDKNNISSVRISVETEDGTTAEINDLSMFLK